MTDRPILFSAPMVQALLAGRKTQTRRVLKLLPPDDADRVFTWFAPPDVPAKGIPNQWAQSGLWAQRNGGAGYNRYCGTLPFRPGDRLWVKETWRTLSAYDADAPSELNPEWATLDYLATPFTEATFWGKTRVSIHMPRWASRLTLVVTDVRVERLQDISEADAIAEGIEPVLRTDSGQFYRNYRNEACPVMAYGAYASLWEHINGPGSWDANPWVVAVTFEVAL